MSALKSRVAAAEKAAGVGDGRVIVVKCHDESGAALSDGTIDALLATHGIQRTPADQLINVVRLFVPGPNESRCEFVNAYPA